MKHRYTTWSILFCWLSISLQAQISFTNQTSTLLQNTEFHSGVAIGIADMNGDNLDDIVRLDQGMMLSIEYQTQAVFDNFSFGNVGATEAEWSLTIADVNNDGFNDILTGGRYDPIKILTAVDAGTNYASQNLPTPNIFLQGSNLADINNDGFLDAFGCHDDGESRIFENDGTGLFNSADDWIDMKTTPSSDNSGNYGSVWTDFDNDGDLDLYIAKCRLGVNDSADPRRINALFVNDGENNYTEQALEHGLKIGHQSWTAEFQDIDNDGDFDCFITNHDVPSQLLENDGSGRFTDITTAAGLDITGFLLQGIMRDFDNDGFMDIITAGPDRLYHNNGDKTFTEISSPFGTPQLKSLTTGDLNHDGFLDIYAGYADNINSPSNVADRIWINNGVFDHNFIAVNLDGNTSNKKGVGARIEIFGEWGIQIREVRAGESYGIATTLTQHFGLGEATSIDHLVVHWPSGTVDVISNPDINQFLTIEEGSTCTLDDFELTATSTTFCEGDMIELSAPAGYTYLWNNGAMTQNLEVTGLGNFKVVIIDMNGCAASSNVISITPDPINSPTISLSGATSFCDGESVTLTASEGLSFLWTNGETSQEVVITEAGSYAVTTEGYCDNYTTDPILIEVLNASAPTALSDTIYSPGVATLTASGDEPYWYETMDATEPLYIGHTFETPIIDATTTYFVEDYVKHGGGLENTGMPEHLGSPYSGNNFNGALEFNVETAFTLKSVKVITDTEGLRIIEIRDLFGNVTHSKEVDLLPGDTILELDFFIEAGNSYQITTNTAQNQASFNFNSPRFQRADDSVDFPYEVEEVMSITGTSFGSGFYYYFFDWVIDKEATECISDRIPVDAVFIFSNTNEVKSLSNFNVYPNPSDGQFTIDILPAKNGKIQLSIIDLSGKVLQTSALQLFENQQVSEKWNLNTFGKGMYFLKIESEGQIGWQKIIVQ